MVLGEAAQGCGTCGLVLNCINSFDKWVVSRWAVFHKGPVPLPYKEGYGSYPPLNYPDANGIDQETTAFLSDGPKHDVSTYPAGKPVPQPPQRIATAFNALLTTWNTIVKHPRSLSSVNSTAKLAFCRRLPQAAVTDSADGGVEGANTKSRTCNCFQLKRCVEVFTCTYTCIWY